MPVLEPRYDRLHAMQIFAEIVATGSFVKAAERLTMAPSAVTKSMQRLEAHLGVQLLMRSTRRVAVTEAGYAFLNSATEIIARVDAVEAELRDRSKELRGKLRITAPMALGRRVLSPLIVTFAQQHPHLDIDWILTDRVVDPIEEQFDLALRTSYQLQNSSLFSLRLAYIRRVICAHPDYLQRTGQVRTLSDLAAKEAVVFLRDQPHVEWALEKNGKTHTVPMRGKFKSNNVHAVIDAVRAGLGVANVPEYTVKDDLENKRLMRVLRSYALTQPSLFALYRQRREQSRKVDALLTFLASRLGAQI